MEPEKQKRIVGGPPKRGQELVEYEATELGELAEFIRKAHADYKDMMSQARKLALPRAIECGAALLRAKAKVKHGQWDGWLKQHCKMSARTGRIYMRAARRARELPKELTKEAIEHMSMRQLTQQIAKPKPPQDAATPSATTEALKVTRSEKQLAQDTLDNLQRCWDQLSAEKFNEYILPELERLVRMGVARRERMERVSEEWFENTFCAEETEGGPVDYDEAVETTARRVKDEE